MTLRSSELRPMCRGVEFYLIQLDHDLRLFLALSTICRSRFQFYPTGS